MVDKRIKRIRSSDIEYRLKVPKKPKEPKEEAFAKPREFKINRRTTWVSLVFASAARCRSIWRWDDIQNSLTFFSWMKSGRVISYWAFTELEQPKNIKHEAQERPKPSSSWCHVFGNSSPARHNLDLRQRSVNQVYF